MIPEFKKFLDLFYLNVSGLWVLSLKDTRERLLKNIPPSILETSIAGEKDININMYELAHKLPEAPFKNKNEVNESIRLQAQLVIIGSYEWLKKSQYWKNGDLKNQPDIVNLFKYIRDTAVHNNIFKFKDKNFLPLTWREKIMNETWEGKSLFPEWMSFGDIQYFLEDVSKELLTSKELKEIKELKGSGTFNSH